MYIIPTLLPRATITTISGVTFTRPTTSASSIITSRTTIYYSATSKASSSFHGYYTTLTPGSSSSSSSGGGLSSPVKIIIPVFATFFAIIVLVFVITACRRAEMYRRFHSKPPPPRIGAINIPQIPMNRSNSPFDIDTPRVTPYPAPVTAMSQINNSGPVIQDIPSVYHSTPTAREQIHDVPGYQQSEGGMTMPPAYDEVIRGNNR
ncbi:uncharacterized protein I206_107467 [Kwoniella pini CBS 10737]|uniref:Transmembrane protein n=1 Tax=Kwoniella pini CBS 10737 TaxID=1296096 RepID=A0A1B9HXE0_9TREE|nr:uncharacterized protein I206_05796 [Kwoniella pini CBS 10737]OCF47932.1 hypothetical protein I206_05796 [Kwoniella pini CBS 10737]